MKDEEKIGGRIMESEAVCGFEFLLHTVRYILYSYKQKQYK